MKAWVYQDHRQKRRHGSKAPWSVGWVDPNGKRRSKRIGSKSIAEKFARKTEGALAAGTCQVRKKTGWPEFKAQFERVVASAMKPPTRRCTMEAVAHLERLMKPQRVDAINTKTIDEFISQCFDPVVFPWYHGPEGLWGEFHRIQREAGIRLPCLESHEHTPACHLYGFHDLRRAFATANADKFSAPILQKLMRHKSYSTTQRYINMSRQLDGSVESLHVPQALLKTGSK